MAKKKKSEIIGEFMAGVSRIIGEFMAWVNGIIGEFSWQERVKLLVSS